MPLPGNHQRSDLLGAGNISSKEQRFCDEYLKNGFDSAAAARVAGYSAHTAKTKGSFLVRKNPKTRRYLEKHFADAEDVAQINLQWKLKQLKQVVEKGFESNNLLAIVAAIREMNKMQGDDNSRQTVIIEGETGLPNQQLLLERIAQYEKELKC